MHQLYEAIIKNLKLVNTQSRDQNSGVWYKAEYEQAFNHQYGTYQSGYANPEYWHNTDFPSGYIFCLNPGKKPSAAIKAFISGLTIAECGTV